MQSDLSYSPSAHVASPSIFSQTGPSSPSVSQPLKHVRRALTPARGRALETLAHAIEYLEDTAPLSIESTPRTLAILEAATILKSLNRDVYLEAPERKSHSDRARLFLRLLLIGGGRRSQPA